MEEPTTRSNPLEIPELLELILSTLSFNDLFATLRVAQSWRRTILTSTPLRRTLFLSPIPTTTAYRLGKLEAQSTYSVTTTNPTPPYTIIPTPSDLNETNLPWATPTLNFLATINPLILRLGSFDGSRTLSERVRLGEHIAVTKSRHRLRSLPLLVGEMFLTQPPCSTMSLWLDFDRAKEFTDSEGVRVRDLVAAVEAKPPPPYWPGVFGMLHNVVCLDEGEREVVANGQICEAK